VPFEAPIMMHPSSQVRGPSCPNRNHTRAAVPVRHCPQCGGVVNGAVPVKHCAEAAHAVYRRQQNRFCIDCGVELIAIR
jgi:rRNA maturation protein Nop10